jgi:hypothetical protein
MKVKKSDIVNNIIKLFDINNNKVKDLLSDSSYAKLIKKLLDQELLVKDIEWVLVIPLWKYINNCDGQYELIFGRGQEITKLDLFLAWDYKTKKVFTLQLKYDEKRRDVMSLHEAHNLATRYGLNMSYIHPHQKPIRYATIENIKECLEVRIAENYSGIFKDFKNRKYLLKPEHSKTGLKYLNIIINLLRDASVVLLGDVYDIRYNIKQGRNKVALGYDPYSVVREFLRFIRIHPERRAGSKNRVRYTNVQEDLILDSYWQYKREVGKKSIEDIINELGFKKPSNNQLEKLKEKAKSYQPS